jgi:hypothetical protein
MTALAANINREEKQAGLLAHEMAVDIIYRGALTKINAAGYLAPCAAESGAKFAGVAYEYMNNSAAGAAVGDEICRVKDQGVFRMTSSGLSITDMFKRVYASDDTTVSTTQGANEQCVGMIVGIISATECWVLLMVKDVLGALIGLAELEDGIKPSHVVKFSGEFTTVGGDANETITVTGALATDIVLVNLHTVGATPRTILTASASADQIDVVMSGDPSTDHVLSYVVLRAAA